MNLAPTDFMTPLDRYTCLLAPQVDIRLPDGWRTQLTPDGDDIALVVTAPLPGGDPLVFGVRARGVDAVSVAHNGSTVVISLAGRALATDVAAHMTDAHRDELARYEDD